MEMTIKKISWQFHKFSSSVAWELCKRIYMGNIYDDIKSYMFKWLSLRNTKSDCDFKGKIILTADWLAK